MTLYFLSLDRVDLLDGRCKAFFTQCKKNPDSQQVEFEKIKEEYKKVIEDASEKIQVAEDCYGLVDRYLRKLDEELHKFKMELEADNRGITEVLEKHSLEMDAAPTMVNLKENRHPKKLVSSEKIAVVLLEPKHISEFQVKKSSLHKTDHHQKFSDVLSAASDLSPSASSSVQILGPGGNAIAQAGILSYAALSFVVFLDRDFLFASLSSYCGHPSINWKENF